ncbi:hypothetical protein ACD591_00770 [Rufibacter glacialis]|uniref:Uncharacterized protein n=1 Tax=Rufibacter glacialis TaxID=1259555 RepID=A0A5M8QKB5_9BACT|nr:hypothetical protein [Rufibacter glacialis]KAA6435440.1 hypothetical protein FOE74_05680 [Rufibacter glacialis]GGK63457.1 hypothetical protein GCM10011405_09370 [Rufibacter glacialis]
MVKFIIAIIIGLTLVISSNIIGYYRGPFSILATAVLPFIIVAGVNYRLYKINFLAAVLYGYGILLLNDLLIRMYAGGTHDQVGKAWISLFTFIGFVLITSSMLVYAFTTVSVTEKINRKRISNLLAVVISGLLTATFYLRILGDV